MTDKTPPTIRIERANVIEGDIVRFISESTPEKDNEILIYDYNDHRKLRGLVSKASIPSDINKRQFQDDDGKIYYIAELDTSGLAAGSYVAIYSQDAGSYASAEIDNVVKFHISASSAGKTDVTLQRSKSFPTKDQALWATIRSSTNAIRFDRYQQFIDLVFDGGTYNSSTRQEQTGFHYHERKGPPEKLSDWLPKLNIYGQYSYTILKMATQAFLAIQCGLKPSGADEISNVFANLINAGNAQELSSFFKERPLDANEEAMRSFDVNGIAQQLSQYMDGGNGNLPYLNRIAKALIAIGPNEKIDGYETLPYYNYILQHRVTNPSLIELIWSYWHEEGMLAQTMNAIALRFQNQRSGPNDPLAELEIDPLRPLNNMIWGFVQDRYNQLSVSRRAAEYDHQYGLRLLGRAVPELSSADSRSKFIEAFHNLLYRTAVFYREDADTTVVSNAFPLLNALKDVHLLLAEGAHNQYGDLPWTARAEMLTQQWMLARPEMREFLRGRHMVPYQETWMGAVDAMKKLQGWTDTTVSHFHELAVDGERILLSIRFGDWSDDLNLTEDNARNWARYWKPEIQRYLYGYLAVTGVDLMNEVTDIRESEVRYLQPSALLQRRLAGQSRQPAALAAPRRQAIAAPAGQGYAALPRPQQTSRVSRLRAIKYEQGE